MKKRAHSKTIAVLLVLALLLSLSGCASKKPTAGPSTQSEELTLAFCASDATEPYSCKTQTNVYLSELVFESLFRIAADKSVKNEIAESYITQDKLITVKLADVKFSDGSPVTADDVVHSFRLAKQSERYKGMLSGFDSAQKKGSDVVMFTLTIRNIYALSLLTFPIVKQSDNHIGSGLYKLSEKNGETILEYNKYHSGKKPQIEIFSLCECKEYTNAVNLFNDAKIDYVFDTLADGNVRSNAINSTKAKLNNLLFLGLNGEKGLFKKALPRKAVSLAIDQTALCEQALKGYALPTATPFDPQWKEIGAIVANSVLSKENDAMDTFLEAGCSYDKMGINLLWKGEQIELTLIVNSANNMKIALAEQIKSQLVGYGIRIEIKKMPLDEYNIAVENRNFDMYIGEVKMQNDFNLDCFFTEGGGADFGIHNEALSQTYLLFKGGNASLQDFVSRFSEDNPFIPLAYKCADVCLNSALKVSGNITENDMYAGIEEWSR